MFNRTVAWGFFVLLFAFVGFVAAEGQTPPSTDQTTDEAPSPDDEEAKTPEGAARVTKRLAEKFHVETTGISDLREQHLGFGEIDHALTLANQLPGGATQENINQIMTMRQEQHMGWGKIAHELDTTLGAAKRAAIQEPGSTESPETTTPPDTATGGTATSSSPAASSLTRSGSAPGSHGKPQGLGVGGGAGSSTVGIERSGGGGPHGPKPGGRRGDGLGHGGGRGSSGGPGGGNNASPHGHNR